MELKAYLQTLLLKWWVVVPALIITFVSGVVFTYTKVPVYSAAATYLVVPSTSPGDTNSFASGLDILGRRDEIATTFAEIAISRKVKTAATEKISLADPANYTIESKLRAGTNILEITTFGIDPVMTRDLANAVGTATEEYVQTLYEVFILTELDEATVVNRPVSPNIPLNLGLSALLGLALGVGLAFLSAYLETPASGHVNINIVDEATGLYNKGYFLKRLGEEMVRAKRNYYPLSLALMQIDNLGLLKGTNSDRVRAEILRQVAILISQYLRDEDVVTYFQSGIFAFLLPDIMGSNAKATMEYLQTRLAWTPFEFEDDGLKFNLSSVVGIVAYNRNGTSRDELVSQAFQALGLAELEEDGKVYLAPDSEKYDA